MWEIMVVAAGGGAGAVSRYLLSNILSAKFGPGFPYGTLVANVVGCFIIGAFMVFATEKWIINPYWRLLVTVGFVGGLTTFSSFSYETLKLFEAANPFLALSNLALNLLAGFSATWAGIILARAF